MAKFLLKIKLNDLCKLIVLTILNKFDFFLCIEGGTGIGKSTLAIHVARGVRMEFKRLYSLREDLVQYYYEKVIEKQMITMEEFCLYLLDLKSKNAYMYNPTRDLIYDQKNMIRALSSWHRIFIPDELINVAFNRDFQGEEQKKIIKLVNMNRDHQNLIIASVPQFQNIDVQIKNLTKMRISVAKRGAGIVQTPNKTFYGKDKWDSVINERIEREWLMQGSKPKYKKLTTARGLIHFPALSRKLFDQYQKIKNEKRANIVEKDFGIGKTDEEKDPLDRVYDDLINKKIRNTHELHGFARALGLDPASLTDRMRRRLVKECKGATISEFFWDQKSQKKIEQMVSIS